MLITKELLVSWSACSDGLNWFVEKYPEGVELLPLLDVLRAEKQTNYKQWFLSRLTQFLWIYSINGKGRANLRGANLSGANLSEADLREADLYGADLSGANLRGARASANPAPERYKLEDGRLWEI